VLLGAGLGLAPGGDALQVFPGGLDEEGVGEIGRKDRVGRAALDEIERRVGLRVLAEEEEGPGAAVLPFLVDLEKEFLAGRLAHLPGAEDDLGTEQAGQRKALAGIGGFLDAEPGPFQAVPALSADGPIGVDDKDQTRLLRIRVHTRGDAYAVPTPSDFP